MIFYDKKAGMDLESVKLVKGFYVFEYPIRENKQAVELTQKSFPIIKTAGGKKVVIHSAWTENKTLKMRVEVVENPIPVLFLVYVLGGLLIAWAITKFIDPLERIVSDVTNVFSPFKMVVALVAILAIMIIPKVLK